MANDINLPIILVSSAVVEFFQGGPAKASPAKSKGVVRFDNIEQFCTSQVSIQVGQLWNRHLQIRDG